MGLTDRNPAQVLATPAVADQRRPLLTRVIASVGRRYDMFISYKRDDAQHYAYALRDLLEGDRLVVFLDHHELRPGMGIDDALRVRIAHSRTLILLDTTRSRSANYVRDEVDCARRHGLQIVRIVFQQVERKTDEEDRWFDQPEYQFLQQLIWQNESVDPATDGPTPATIQGLIREYRFTRLRTYVVTFLTVIAAILAVTVGVFVADAAARRDAERLLMSLRRESEPLKAALEEAADIFSAWYFPIYNAMASEVYSDLRQQFSRTVLKAGPFNPDERKIAIPLPGREWRVGDLTYKAETSIISAVDSDGHPAFRQAFRRVLDAMVLADWNLLLVVSTTIAPGQVEVSAVDLSGGLVLEQIHVQVPGSIAVLGREGNAVRLVSRSGWRSLEIVPVERQHLAHLKDFRHRNQANAEVSAARLGPRRESATVVTDTNVVYTCRLHPQPMCHVFTALPETDSTGATVPPWDVTDALLTTSRDSFDVLWLQRRSGGHARYARQTTAEPAGAPSKVAGRLIPRGNDRIGVSPGCSSVTFLRDDGAAGHHQEIAGRDIGSCRLLGIDPFAFRGILARDGVFARFGHGWMRQILPSDLHPALGPGMRIVAARAGPASGPLVFAAEDEEGSAVYLLPSHDAGRRSAVPIYGARSFGKVWDVHVNAAPKPEIVALEQWNRSVVVRTYPLSHTGFSDQLRARVERQSNATPK